MTGPDVVIDGERVEFSGAAPDGLENLLAAVSPVLAESGRLVASVEVPGRGVVQELSAADFAAAPRIDLLTVSMAEAISHVAKDNAVRIAAALDAADRLAGDVMRVAWTDGQTRCRDLAGQLGRVAEDATGMPQEAALVEVLGAFAVALDRWMDAVQAGEAAQVCLRLDQEIIPVLRRLRSAVDALAGGAG